MEYVKVDDKVAEALGRPRRSIINAIAEGNLKGKRFSPRDTRIEASELPDSFFASGKAPEGESSVEVSTDKDPPSIPTDLQNTLDNTKLQEAKIKEIEISKKLAEAEGLRDLPDVIKQREEESFKRDELSKQKEELATQRDSLSIQREEVIKEKEVSLIAQADGVEKYVKEQTDEADSILAEATSYNEGKVKEADDYYASKVKDADNFDADIQAKKAELEMLNTQVEEEINKHVSEIKQWTKVANTNATRSYRIAQRTTGKMETYHIKRSNRLWWLKDALDRILKAIG